MDITPVINNILSLHGAHAVQKPAYSADALDGFVREAYGINKRVTELVSYLRALRQPYLSTAPPPRRRHPALQDASQGQKYLTDTQRDQIDAESKTFLRDLHAAVHGLSQAEQNRQAQENALTQKRRRRNGFGALGSWAAGGGTTAKSPEQAEEDARASMIKLHREGIIWFLQRRLEECGRIQSSMMEIRLRREVEKSKSILHKARSTAGPVPVWTDMEGLEPKKTHKRYSSRGNAQEAVGSTGDQSLSQEQVQLFAQEGQDMLKLYEDRLDQVRTAEKSLVEISELQSALAANLEIQSAHIDQLVQDSYLTETNVGMGNKELKKASERRSTARMVFYGTAGFCSVLVLWDLIT